MVIGMSNGQTDDNGRRTYSSDDNDDNFANGYYEHNSNGPAGDALEEAEDNGHDNEVVIDFDSGDLVIIDSAFYAYGDGYFDDGLYGTYTEDGFTLEWQSYDYVCGIENSDNLGAPFVNQSNANHHEANEHSDDLAFGVNYANGDSGNDDGGYEFTIGVFTKDDGGSFSLDDVDMAITDSDNYNKVLIGTDSTVGTVYTSLGAYTYDLESWTEYSFVYDFDAGTYDLSETSDNTWDDVLDSDIFDDINTMTVQLYGSATMDNVEFDDIA